MLVRVNVIDPYYKTSADSGVHSGVHGVEFTNGFLF